MQDGCMPSAWLTVSRVRGATPFVLIAWLAFLTWPFCRWCAVDLTMTSTVGGSGAAGEPRGRAGAQVDGEHHGRRNCLEGRDFDCDGAVGRRQLGGGDDDVRRERFEVQDSVEESEAVVVLDPLVELGVEPLQEWLQRVAPGTLQAVVPAREWGKLREWSGGEVDAGEVGGEGIKAVGKGEREVGVVCVVLLDVVECLEDGSGIWCACRSGWHCCVG